MSLLDGFVLKMLCAVNVDVVRVLIIGNDEKENATGLEFTIQPRFFLEVCVSRS